MDSPPDEGPCSLTITAPDRSWLHAFARGLVYDKLAAAAHIDSIDTTYRWRGEVVDAHEARACVHTVFGCVEQIAQRVREEHPYEVACVAAQPISQGEPDYLRWIRDSVRPKNKCNVRSAKEEMS